MTVRMLAIVLPLALDTFAVAAALGTHGHSAGARRRVATVMAAFEVGMPLIGLALGAPLGRAIGSTAEIPAVILLAGLGLHMLLSDDDDDDASAAISRTTSPARLMVLGLSVSLDELAIGFTLGLLRVPVVPALVLIGAQAFIAAQLGLRLGARLRERTREGAERLAGVALVVLAIVLLGERLAA